MSLAIVIGFTGTQRSAAASNLYTGQDLTEARRILEAPPVGIRRTEMIINPVAARRRIHDIAPTETEAPVETEVPAETEVTTDPDSQPDDAPAGKKGKK